MRRNKRKTIKMSLLMMLLLLGIGFAALTANLKINGTVDVTRSSWDVHFENVQVTTGSVTATTAPTSDDATTTEMTYAVNFTKPGDFYEFTVDMVNDGSIDAMVEVVSNNVYENASSTTPITLPTYLNSTVTYNDGISIVQNQKLLHGTSEKIKVRVEFRTDISASDLPSDGDTTVVFKFSGTFKQKNNNAKPIRVDFSTASWDEITTAYTNNPLSLQQSMLNGTTKEVQLDLDNDGTAETTAHLRIANISTPTECSTQGFSQSACGLVIEFADIITTHRINPYVYGNSTTTGVNGKGGWEYSDMRAYLNSTTYVYENIDYSSAGIFNSLPSDLKSKIINTTVVSGHGYYDSTNFTTTDKLYLLDPKEIYGTSYANQYDAVKDFERQLDYYRNIGVTTSNYSGTIKKKLNGTAFNWWLRSFSSDLGNQNFLVLNNGSYTHGSTEQLLGVSPAFRIG